ncbi:MAG TPA: TonB-dependent receptor [Thermoanaerobaculia bacterium]|nr:TonB-dependent receptor [Thermoanaerobaculia bacterium]
MDTTLLALLLLFSDPSSQYSESIVVSAIRADETTPVTKTDIPRGEIERDYHGQDVPLLLRDAPSVHAWAESGAGGSGYSYITLRGVSPTRINFTLDGVPLADSEDMGTYFADFPDLARSLQSIQIQRGVGTSTFGSASFGGSVNMESIDVAQDQGVDATFGGGSYGNTQATIGYQSGKLPGDFAFYTRVSYLDSEGFRENAGTKQRNVFFSGTKLLGDAQLRLTGFSGHEAQQLHYYAADADTLAHDLRNNPMRPEEKDSFGYDLAQLQYIRPLDASSDMTASVYYQRGYGWYRLFDFGTDDLREYGLDGMLLGSILTYSHRAGAFTWNTGLHVNRFQRDHTRDDLQTNTRDYANDGVKSEANAFAKLTWTAGPWHLYGDAQVRRATFAYHGDVDMPSIAWTFFNPKIGARYALSSSSSVYASAGITTREPTRSDLFLGEDNPTAPHDLHAVRPERLLDLEVGWNHRLGPVDLIANVYAMEFHNEIAATGEINELGLFLRRNVDRSSRRGIELDAAWQATKSVRLNTTANLSRNRIHEWTQFFDVYDADGNWVESRPVSYRNVEPLLTPDVIVNQSIDYAPNARFSTGATARWVGRSYLDNTNDSAFATPSFVTVDAKASYAVTPNVRVSLEVNNVTNNDRVYASGYSYRYFSDDVRTGTAYYFPQATRNAVVLFNVTR